MNMISNIPDEKDKKRVIILGGGFAGLKLIQKLDRSLYQVVLMDQRNNYQFQPLLYQVATSGIEPSSISFPFRKIFQKYQGLHYRMCKALSVNRSANVLTTSIGDIDYDYLVVAMGCDTNFYGNSALCSQTLTLKSTSEALNIRNSILQNMEDAVNTSNDDLRRELLTFVIVGGGPTGVEMSGAIAEMKKFVFPKDYPQLDQSEINIYLVNGMDRVLATFDAALSAKTEDHLKKMGVNVINNLFVTDYDGSTLKMSDKSTLNSKNVIWVAGVKPNHLEGLSPEVILKNERILTDEYNLVKGEKNIFAIGDIAFVENGKDNEQVAQVAMQQAENLARNLNRGLADNKPFIYNNKGSMATIGRNAAIAEIGNYKFSGFMAWFIWCFVHLRSIFGLKNKLTVFIDWLWSYITYDQSLRLIFNSKRECEKKEKI